MTDSTDATEELEAALIKAVKTWDCEDINDLYHALAQIKEYDARTSKLDMRLSDFIDMSNLPSCPVPDGVEGYPVWAVDRQGMALVGEVADETMPLADVVAYYQNK